MKTPFTALAVAAALVLAGCSTTSQIIVGTPREPIAPEQVRIFLREPKSYEEIALLNTSSEDSWAFTEQEKMDTVVRRLKEEAAKLGANGVLLREAGDQYTGSVSTGTVAGRSHHSRTTVIETTVPMMEKAATGVAIFVLEE